ncbi:hypothetical protein QNH14_12640 [Apirhabdus apintestini]|nr:hypothetical protein QNH14_12640 [Enterobacteriaceae bacterium CA-0114]
MGGHAGGVRAMNTVCAPCVEMTGDKRKREFVSSSVCADAFLPALTPGAQAPGLQVNDTFINTLMDEETL